MIIRHQNQATLSIDFQEGCITSLQMNHTELATGKTPLFAIRMRDASGTPFLTDTFAASACTLTAEGAVYSGFPYDILVEVKISGTALATWQIAIRNHTDLVIEYVDFPCMRLKALKQNGGEASLLLPYNEGVLIEDMTLRQNSWFPHQEPEYPSHGSYYMFPYMISSQFLCYLLEDCGLYLGAHDPSRAPKGLQCHPATEGSNDIRICLRLFTGCTFGADYLCEYPVCMEAFAGTWHDGAAIYKEWFQKHLPPRAAKIRENPLLPEWYKDSPLVLSYPVRGIHDMDEMKPNALFPYSNALPLVEEIATVTGCRILVLLMHWEGTAPWAPPYVWPPFGGEECLNDFLTQLHAKGHLLGVYCSGFGWTLKSNLLPEYDNTAAYQQQPKLEAAMCASPSGEVCISRICPGQRSGYDLCAASDGAKDILEEAYSPLLKSDLDYAQILDQNHGGSQYFCYSQKHSHPPVPGSWMTDNMQQLLTGWNETAGSMLLGCESACAEPYIGNLLFSDNRYELNWLVGQPVPLYSFLYHEYLRNFMGNQVCCAFSNEEDTMCARLAYSFSAGDCMTLVLTPDGRLMNNWGCHDFSNLPNKEHALHFIANLNRFYQEEAGAFLHCGNMIKPLHYHCCTVSFPTIDKRTVSLASVFSTAWEKDGKRIQIFVNHTDRPVAIRLEDDMVLTVPALDACLITLN